MVKNLYQCKKCKVVSTRKGQKPRKCGACGKRRFRKLKLDRYVD